MEADHSLNQDNMSTDSPPLPPSSSTSSSFSTIPSPPRNLLKRSRSLDSLSLSAHQQIQSLSFNSNPNQSTSPDSDSDSDSDEESAPKRTRKVSIDLDPATPQEDQEQEQEVAPKLDIQGIAQELNCGICLELVHRPSTVVPCLHSFCWHCIYSFTRPETPTKTSQNCPHCLQKITLVKPNSSLDSLKTLLLNFEPQRERPALEIMQANDEFQNWKVRSGSGEIRPAPIRYDEDHYQDEEDGFGFGIQSRPVSNPNLIWPCVTCSPGNLSGYTCLHPIPAPSPDLLTINDHSPTRGQRWPPLNASNSIHHAQCEACSKYVPRFSGERSSYCAACLVYSCEPFEQNGCPQPNEDTNLDLLPEASYDDCSIRNLSSNVGIAGFQFLNDEISEEEREKVEKKLEEFLEYTDEKALCLHEIASSIYSISTKLLQDKKKERESLNGPTNSDVVATQETPAVVAAAAAAAAAVVAETPAVPELIKLCPKRDEEGERLPLEFDEKTAEAICNSSFCSGCSVVILCDLLYSWWIEESKKFPPKRDPVDLYSGGVLYPSIVAGQA